MMEISLRMDTVLGSRLPYDRNQLRMETVLGRRLLYDGNKSANGNCSWFKAAI